MSQFQDHQWRHIVATTVKVAPWMFNAEAQHLDLSPEAALLLNLEPEQAQLSLTQFGALLKPTHRVWLEDVLEEARQKIPFSLDLALSDAEGVRWIRMQGQTDSQSQDLIGVFEDITATKRTAISREDLLYRMEFALKSANVGIWDWDIVENKIIWDDKMYQLYGISPDQFSGAFDAWRAGVHPEDDERASREVERAAATGEPFSSQFRVVHPDGSIHHLRAFALVEQDENKKPLRMIGTNWDITDVKTHEENLVKAKHQAEQASRAKSDFLASMSHELRTPMNSILGFAQLLEIEKLSHKQETFVDHILKSGSHLLALIDELLDLARIESGRMIFVKEPVDVAKLVTDCVGMIEDVAVKHRISVMTPMLGLSSPWMLVDPTRIKQCLLNLLSNAVKYNKEGGAIVIHWHAKDWEWVQIDVTDTGIGIPAEKLDLLFQPFSRLGAENSDIEGTGVGLALTKQMMTQMGGRVTVESDFGSGSTFRLEAPWSPPVKSGKAKSRETASPLAERTLLYVEDNPSNLFLMEALIEDIDGLRLLTAHTASFGLELAQSHLPDLIILDINLPGMNGLAALEEIQKNPRLRETPVIALSANAMPADIELALNAGFREYLTKPLDVRNMKLVLRKYLKTAAP